MKSKWTIAGSIVAIVLLALAVGFSQAQGPEPPEGGVGPQGEAGVQAVVDNVIPIQGRLTDASGNPLNGNYNITASIYNVSSGGTALCSRTGGVAVNNGLFNIEIYCSGNTVNGQQLYLGIRVSSDAEMTPRQAIYPVPYAWSLRPGAIISDTRTGAILSVQNYGSGSGVYGYSETGIAIRAAGSGVIQSTAVSRVFIPGGEAVVGGTATDVSLTYWGQGRVDVKTTSSGITRTVIIPIPLPAVLYGQQVRIADIRVYYKTSDSASYITETDLYREQVGGGFYSLIENTGDRNSTSDTYYHLYCNDTNCRLSDDEGFVSVRLQLYFSNSAHTITLGGVRVTLEHE